MVPTVLGITAAGWAIAMALSPILQIRKMVELRSSGGVSIAYFVVLLIGFALWICYGVARHDLPLVIPNSVALVVAAGTIGVAARLR